MKPSSMIFKLLAGCVVLVYGVSQAQAQTIYRIVGANGKVTFSDKPPADVTKATATNAGGKPIATSDAPLPYELRQVVSRFPVTLYSGASCAPCNSGRLLLQSRGIPFTEHTISTPEDAEALQRISGENSLPFLTIGGQKIKGYSETEWALFLTAANYPTTSLLPTAYRNPAAKPLVAVQKPTPAQTPAQAQDTGEEKSASSPPVAPAAASPSNPGGIKF